MANALLAKDPAETCVLVTGGAGFIVSHTVVELLERNYQVVIVDDLSNSSREAVRRVGEITGVAPVFADLPNEEEAEAVAAVSGAAVREVAPGPSLTFYEANILDRAALETIFTMHAVDVIIHFAGFKAVGESVAKPLEYYWNNIAGTLVLCDVARNHGVKNIVFSSSATVYGEPEFIPITEECPKHDCTNPYGWTKSMLEQVLTDLYVGDNEWNVVLLRYFNPIGAHESGRIGEDPKGIPNNLLPYVAQVAVGKLEQVGVFGDDYPTPDGTGVRDYIHVVDLARGHVAALDWMGGKVGTGAPLGGWRASGRRNAPGRGHFQPGHGEGLFRARRHSRLRGCVRPRDSLPHHGPAPRRHRGVLRRRHEGPRRAGLDDRIRHGAHVRGRLALAVPKPRRLRGRGVGAGAPRAHFSQD